MPVSPRELELRVRAALPVGAEFARENFAGDPLVREFCEWAKSELEVEAEIFVAWACPPDVLIVSAPGANILIRSERFDTLLVEYIRLKNAVSHQGRAATKLLLPPAVLRWMAEFLLGYRWPQGALYAARRALDLRDDPRPPNPFRDEILASIDKAQRAAAQCFCLAHELGHLMPSHHDEISLDARVDGLSLSRYIIRELEEAGTTYGAEPMMKLARDRIDASVLLREIDADLIALELVAVFVTNKLGVPAEDALRVSLSACEAQSFLYAMKHACLLLKRHSGRARSHEEFMTGDWISGMQISVRAGCLLRRAGILLSRWRARDQEQTAATINRFVPVVDAMFMESMEFRADLQTVAFQEAENLFCSVPTHDADEGRAFFSSLLDQARQNSDFRLDLFYMLVAMGFPGGTDPLKWLEYLFKMQQGVR